MTDAALFLKTVSNLGSQSREKEGGGRLNREVLSVALRAGHQGTFIQCLELTGAQKAIVSLIKGGGLLCPKHPSHLSTLCPIYQHTWSHFLQGWGRNSTKH